MTALAGLQNSSMRAGSLDVLNMLSGTASNQLQRQTSEALGVLGQAADQGLRELDTGFSSTADAISAIASGAGNAQQLLASLSGVNGRGAPQAAYNDFISSPGQQFLRDRGERAILRNAAATGGTVGGNVLKRLNEHGIGVAAQDFQNHFNRLSGVSDRGLSASNLLSGIRMGQGQNKAGLITNRGVTAANLLSGLGLGLSNISMTGALTGQGAITRAGELLGEARSQTGRDIASSIADTTNRLAEVQFGDVLADLIGGNSAALSNLIIAVQSGDANSKEQLAQLLANLAGWFSCRVARNPWNTGGAGRSKQVLVCAFLTKKE